jgi:hypothetical protein
MAVITYTNRQFGLRAQNATQVQAPDSVAGLSMALLAMIADRILQAYAV